MADPPVLGFNKPYPAHPMDPNDPNYDPKLDPHNPQYDPNDPRLVGGVSPYVVAHGQPPQAPPLTGPQQSYSNVSAMPAGPGGGASGQAGQMQSSYNNSPYSSRPQGTIGNTGAPQAQGQNELAGQGGRGLAQYQSIPSWTGSPLSQSPPARDEGEFQAPPLNAPAPLRQRQQIQAMRERLIQQAFANMPHGYKFKLG